MSGFQFCAPTIIRWFAIFLLLVVGVCVIADHEEHSRTRTNLPAVEDCSDGHYCSDIQGFKAIAELHRQLDDDQDGQVDIVESDDFLREELEYENGQERQKAFHRHKKGITISDLWETWKKSEVHNWTVQDTAEWLSTVVELPQYSTTFTDNAVDGATLPRLASNTHFLSQTLGIKDPIHKQKILVKAIDAVLFGPAKNHSYIKDILLSGMVLITTVGCWCAYVQKCRSQKQLKRIQQELESLQNAEEALQELHKELNRAKHQNADVVSLKEELAKKLYSSNDSKDKGGNHRDTGDDDVRFQQMQEELQSLREQLQQARMQLEANRWVPPHKLQGWLQLTYELESRHFNTKKALAEQELAAAKEGCEKLRKKRTAMLGSFRLAHGNSIDDVDGRILKAKSSLAELTQDLKERLYRWKKIEEQCGFGICSNPGLVHLQSAYHNPHTEGLLHLQSSATHNGNLEMLGDDYDGFSRISATALFSGEMAARPSPPRRSLLHHDSGSSLYDCHSSSASTPSDMVTSTCFAPPAIGGNCIAGTGLHGSVSMVENTSTIPCTTTTTRNSSSDNSLNNSTSSISDQKSFHHVPSVGLQHHQATFIVGGSTFESSPEIEEPPLSMSAQNSRPTQWHRVKSFSQDQTTPPRDVAEVPKSQSEIALNNSATSHSQQSSTVPVSSAQSRKISAPAQVQVATVDEEQSFDSSSVISEEDGKEKKKTKRLHIFRFKNKRKIL